MPFSCGQLSSCYYVHGPLLRSRCCQRLHRKSSQTRCLRHCQSRTAHPVDQNQFPFNQDHRIGALEFQRRQAALFRNTLTLSSSAERFTGACPGAGRLQPPCWVLAVLHAPSARNRFFELQHAEVIIQNQQNPGQSTTSWGLAVTSREVPGGCCHGKPLKGNTCGTIANSEQHKPYRTRTSRASMAGACAKTLAAPRGGALVRGPLFLVPRNAPSRVARTRELPPKTGNHPIHGQFCAYPWNG